MTDGLRNARLGLILRDHLEATFGRRNWTEDEAREVLKRHLVAPLALPQANGGDAHATVTLQKRKGKERPWLRFIAYDLVGACMGEVNGYTVAAIREEWPGFTLIPWDDATDAQRLEAIELSMPF